MDQHLFTLNDIKKRIGHKNVFRVTIERLAPQHPTTMYVAQRIDERRWTVKQLPLEQIKKSWDDVIDTAIDAVVEEPRQYLGASVVGHNCERHVQFHLLSARGEVSRNPVNARIKRIFDRGNLYEDRARKWLKDAGFLFGTTKQGKSFSDFSGQFKGHVDGVITGWRNKDIPLRLIS